MQLQIRVPWKHDHVRVVRLRPEPWQRQQRTVEVHLDRFGCAGTEIQGRVIRIGLIENPTLIGKRQFGNVARRTADPVEYILSIPNRFFDIGILCAPSEKARIP